MMADKEAQCPDCEQIYAIRFMRYVKVADGWLYLCTQCRAKRKAQGTAEG